MLAACLNQEGFVLSTKLGSYLVVRPSIIESWNWEVGRFRSGWSFPGSAKGFE